MIGHKYAWAKPLGGFTTDPHHLVKGAIDPGPPPGHRQFRRPDDSDPKLVAEYESRLHLWMLLNVLHRIQQQADNGEV